MKINVTVDLEEFYGDEDLTLSESVKVELTNRVKNEIWKIFKEESLQSFDNQVKKQISLDKDLKIKETLDDLFSNKKIKKSYSGGQMITVQEYLEEEIDRNIGASNEFDRRTREFILKQSETISKGLKDRYDMLFASQIVNKLNEQGLLKEDIAKILLDK